jgi:hypothetical protein
MRLLIIAILFANLTAGTYESLIKEYRSFTDEQKESLRASYEFGYPADLGYTLAAIEWQESVAGKYKINLQDPSAGAHGISIMTYMSRHKDEITNTPFNRNRVAQMLIDSHTLSCREALDELLDWQRVHNNNWSKIVRSYNAGYSWNGPQAQKYLTAIRAKIKVLKIYVQL